jgi:hypothetical protein
MMPQQQTGAPTSRAPGAFIKTGANRVDRHQKMKEQQQQLMPGGPLQFMSIPGQMGGMPRGQPSLGMSPPMMMGMSPGMRPPVAFPRSPPPPPPPPPGFGFGSQRGIDPNEV